MKPTAITVDQLKHLQVLYGQLCARSLDYDKSREARPAWAVSLVRREIASFSDLSISEGKHLIDCARTALGLETNAKHYDGGPRNQGDRERAGKDGRRDGKFETTMMVRAEDLDKLQAVMLQLGWDEARLALFLRSRRSPLRHHRTDRILTVAHANKVIWALKGMLRQGKVPA